MKKPGKMPDILDTLIYVRMSLILHFVNVKGLYKTVANVAQTNPKIMNISSCFTA